VSSSKVTSICGTPAQQKQQSQNKLSEQTSADLEEQAGCQ
jgi:hypothetical protein